MDKSELVSKKKKKKNLWGCQGPVTVVTVIGTNTFWSLLSFLTIWPVKLMYAFVLKKKVCGTITIVFIYSLLNQDVWNISLRESTLKYILRLSSMCTVDLEHHLSRCCRHLSQCCRHLSEWFSEILKKSDVFSWNVFYIHLRLIRKALLVVKQSFCVHLFK